MNAQTRIENAVTRPYRKPVLVKGPVLTGVTAIKAVSGSVPSDGFCWVARAAFGEHDLSWMIFRAWLLDDAPRWFLRGYQRYGRQVGAHVARHAFARRLVRALMMPAIKQKAGVQ